MIATDPVPPIDDDEMLDRFIVNSSEFRKDNTVKPKLFLPYSRIELSLNWHRDCDENEICDVGAYVAATRKCTFYGRSDIRAEKCNIAPLKVVAMPIKDKPDQPNNPNHADITGYPAAKAEQMSLAAKLAAVAGLRKEPPNASGAT